MPDMQPAIDRLDQLAAAVPEGDWERGGIGDFGWTVFMGQTSVETPDDDEGRALAEFLEAMSPAFARNVTALLRTILAPSRNDAEGPGIHALAARVAESIPLPKPDGGYAADFAATP